MSNSSNATNGFINLNDAKKASPLTITGRMARGYYGEPRAAVAKHNAAVRRMAESIRKMKEGE